MGENVRSVEQVRAVNHSLQEEARRQGREWPLIISVDQEGGTVARVRDGVTEFPTYMTLGAAGDPALARRVARASGTELRALGFTMVFAPDADVTVGPSDPTIGSRSAGSDPELVARIVKGSLRGYADAGIVAVPKHFPGHGSVPADSHTSLPVQRASLEQLSSRDLVPFRAAVAAGAEAVMVAHIDVREVDPGTPSSLSGPIITHLLRDRLGFQGVVVTDALQMAGAAEEYGSAEAGVRALLAGADILLLPDDAGALHAAIVRAVRTGRVAGPRFE
jgi:beta-N-acetylhexosaminidase